MPSAPEFSFELSDKAAIHNLAVLRKYQFDLSKALEANKDLPLKPGKEFKPPNIRQKLFGHHSLRSHMEAILTHGSVWPLVELDEDLRKLDLQEALTFGNHKGASAKPEALQKLIDKDVKYGYSITIPISCVTPIPGLCMAPMNIMAQNTIDELERIFPKDRLARD
jgi:hypothetical protein